MHPALVASNATSPKEAQIAAAALINGEVGTAEVSVLVLKTGLVIGIATVASTTLPHAHHATSARRVSPEVSMVSVVVVDLIEITKVTEHKPAVISATLATETSGAIETVIRAPEIGPVLPARLTISHIVNHVLSATSKNPATQVAGSILVIGVSIQTPGILHEATDLVAANRTMGALAVATFKTAVTTAETTTVIMTPSAVFPDVQIMVVQGIGTVQAVIFIIMLREQAVKPAMSQNRRVDTLHGFVRCLRVFLLFPVCRPLLDVCLGVTGEWFFVQGRGEDWACQYCGTTNRQSRGSCIKCNRSVDGPPQDDPSPGPQVAPGTASATSQVVPDVPDQAPAPAPAPVPSLTSTPAPAPDVKNAW